MHYRGKERFSFILEIYTTRYRPSVYFPRLKSTIKTTRVGFYLQVHYVQAADST